MTETIQWRELTPYQRDMEIATKVMRLNLLCTGKLTRLERDQFQLRTAYTCLECNVVLTITDFFLETGPLPAQHMKHVPPYTTSLDAAWKVLQEMVERKEPNEGEYRISAQFETFAVQMLTISGWDEATAWSEIYPAGEMFVMAAQWTPEAICIAALRACGCTVANEGGETDERSE